MGRPAAAGPGHLGVKVRSPADPPGRHLRAAPSLIPPAAHASYLRREPDKSSHVFLLRQRIIPNRILGFSEQRGDLNGCSAAGGCAVARSLSLPGAAAGNHQKGVGGPGDGRLSGASGTNRSCQVRVVGAQRCPCGRQVGGRASELGSGRGVATQSWVGLREESCGSGEINK